MMTDGDGGRSEGDSAPAPYESKPWPAGATPLDAEPPPGRALAFDVQPPVIKPARTILAPARRPEPSAAGAAVRDVFEALAVAVILALVIKHFAIEAYKVPTGSMEPMILGDEKTGDRIIVSRLAYDLRDPARWDVAVFRYPNNQTINYIKRVVGLPKETLFVLAGDIYTAPPGNEYADILELWKQGKLKVERKPRPVQDDIFAVYPQIEEKDVANLTVESFHRYWNVPSPALAGEVEWTIAGGEVKARSRTTTWAGFRDMVTDNREFTPAGPTNRGGHNSVGDVRVDLEVKPLVEGGGYRCEITDAQHPRTIEASVPAAGAAADGGILLGGALVATLGTYRLPAGRFTRVTLANADNRIELRIDGETLATYDYDHAPSLATSLSAPPVCRIGVEAGEMAFRRIAVYRDLHYQGSGRHDTGGTNTRVDIPENMYYMLGDNSPSSKDSREWRMRTIYPPAYGGRPLRGDTEAVLDPHDLTSRIDNPWWDTVKKRHSFMDEFGNVRDVTSGTGEWSEGPSPFVDRELIIGRAFAVFMPLTRLKLIR
jgi:signal peptidase I